MGMLCPVCKTLSFETVTLERELETVRCGRCGGHWISAAHYFRFAEAANEGVPGSVPGNEAAGEQMARVEEEPALKLCPECRKFMRWYPVGHGIAFGIDKCGTCGGVWLNDGEWEALKARGLRLKLHAISDDRWQAEVHRQRRADAARDALAKRLGAGELAELDRVAMWLATHPHREEMFAYLERRFRGERREI